MKKLFSFFYKKNSCSKDFYIYRPNPEPLDLQPSDKLMFHSACGSHAAVINSGITSHRPNAADDFNFGVVLTNRFLKSNEVFEVRLDKMVSKWAGSIEIGVTTHSPTDLGNASTKMHNVLCLRIFHVFQCRFSEYNDKYKIWNLDDDWKRSYAQWDHHNRRLWSKFRQTKGNLNF